MNKTPDHPKGLLRSEMKATLSSYSQELLLEKSERVYNHLKIVLDDRNVRHRLDDSKSIAVGVYAPMIGEVVLTKLEHDFVCAYPSFDSARSEMIFRRSKLLELEESKEFGVVLKTPSHLCPEVEPDVILVPGLAFSPQGKRLGRGKGFYDRYLAQYRGVKIGVCFKEQLKDSVPVEDHDQYMDFVVSDDGHFLCR